MPTSYAGSSASFPTTVQLPSDGDQRNASSINAPLTSLADRTSYLAARNVNGLEGGTVAPAAPIVVGGAGLIVGGGGLIIGGTGHAVTADNALTVYGNSEFTGAILLSTRGKITHKLQIPDTSTVQDIDTRVRPSVAKRWQIPNITANRDWYLWNGGIPYSGEPLPLSGDEVSISIGDSLLSGHTVTVYDRDMTTPSLPLSIATFAASGAGTVRSATFIYNATAGHWILWSADRN